MDVRTISVGVRDRISFRILCYFVPVKWLRKVECFFFAVLMRIIFLYENMYILYSII